MAEAEQAWIATSHEPGFVTPDARQRPEPRLAGRWPTSPGGLRSVHAD